MIDINITENKHTAVMFVDKISQTGETCAELSGKKVAVLAPESQSKNAAALINALWALRAARIQGLSPFAAAYSAERCSIV